MENNIPEWYIEFLKGYENFSSTPYDDTAVNIFDKNGKRIPAWTIGYGTMSYPDGRPVRPTDRTVTKEEAVGFIKPYLQKSYQKLSTQIPNWNKLSEQQKMALIDITYRGGLSNLETKSPKFKSALVNLPINPTAKDFEDLIKESETAATASNSNLRERKERRLAMLAGLYDTKDNANINYATSGIQPYKNFHLTFLDPKMAWNAAYKISNKFKGVDKSDLAYETTGDKSIVYNSNPDLNIFQRFRNFFMKYNPKELQNISYNKGDSLHFNMGKIGIEKAIDRSNTKKLGGTINYFSLFKSGGQIHIKKSHEGLFTKYCNGKVTQECINKGKNSSDPKIRRRAIFAENARKFKH